MLVKALADVVIPQEYGMTETEKLAIGQGTCAPLLSPFFFLSSSSSSSFFTLPWSYLVLPIFT